MLDGLYDVSRMIRQQAPDDVSRDLGRDPGIVADGQLARHCRIAAFGTIRIHADQLGLSETAWATQASLDEAKQGDAAHAAVATRILGD